MFSFAAYVGRRLRMHADGQRTATGVIVAVAGVAVAFVVMMLSVAIVAGFKEQIIARLDGLNAPVTVTATVSDALSGYNEVTFPIQLTPEMETALESTVPGGASVEPVVSLPAILKTDADFAGIIIKSLPQERNAAFLYQNMVEEICPVQVANGDSCIIYLSSATAKALGVGVGDKLRSHFLDDNNMRTRQFAVGGVFDTHFRDFDRVTAFAPLATLRSIARMDSTMCTQLELAPISGKCEPVVMANATATALRPFLSLEPEAPVFHIVDVTEQCANYFAWLDLLDTNVLVILGLMGAVAAFTLISSMFIIVLERVPVIGLLKSIGASTGQIRNIFIYMAMRLVGRGLLIGNAVALTIIWIQRTWGVLPLDADAYYLSYVPMYFSLRMVLMLNAGVLVGAWLVLILPSQIVARVSPAQTMRYE